MSPSASPQAKMITRGISLLPALNQRLIAQAHREERSVSSLIRRALRDYLARAEPLTASPPIAVRVRAAAQGETHETGT